MATTKYSSLMQSDEELHSNQAEVANVAPDRIGMATRNGSNGLMAEETVESRTEHRVRITLTAFQQLASYLAGLPQAQELDVGLSVPFQIDLFPDTDLKTPSRAQQAFMNELQRTADLCASAQIAVYTGRAAGLANDSAVTADSTMPTMENMGMSPNHGSNLYWDSRAAKLHRVLAQDHLRKSLSSTATVSKMFLSKSPTRACTTTP